MPVRSSWFVYLVTTTGTKIPTSSSTPAFTVAIRKETVLLGACRLQAVTIKKFTTSPSFETATNRTKRRMGQWGTQDFPEPSPCDQRRKITLSPPWSIAMLQGAPTNPVATQLLPTHHREGGSDELGMAATSRSTQPLQSNNLKEVCRASAEPTVPSDNASSTAEGPTAASGVAVMSGGRGIVFLPAN